MAKIRKVTAATRAAILRKSAYALPNNPSDAGFGADDIRGALFRPLTDERDSALSELDRVAAETGSSRLPRPRPIRCSGKAAIICTA